MLNCENKTRISEELPIMHYFLLLLLSMLFFLNIFYCKIYIVYNLIEDKFYSFYKVLSRMFIMLVVYVFKLYVFVNMYFQGGGMFFLRARFFYTKQKLQIKYFDFTTKFSFKTSGSYYYFFFVSFRSSCFFYKIR